LSVGRLAVGAGAFANLATQGAGAFANLATLGCASGLPSTLNIAGLASRTAHQVLVTASVSVR
jgi:hypothetical protein